jgi:hypothetical protein
MKKIIMTEKASGNTSDTEVEDRIEADEPRDLAIDWVHEVMRLNTAGKEVFDAELIRLVDELGMDFVCQHVCEEELEGGERCPDGHCEAWGDCCTCGEGMQTYIEDFIGTPIRK